MFEIQNCCLVVVDVQGKLAELMHDKESLFRNLFILVKAAKILEIPVVLCQQNPKALGQTISEITEVLNVEPIDKFSFSCCGNEDFNSKLNALNRKEVLLCGIETHVCIYQTALDLKQKGFQIGVVADAVSSRAASNKQLALERLRANQVDVSSTEMILFELLKTAKHPDFREISRLVK